MKRKIILCIVVAVTTLTLLAACGGGKNNIDKLGENISHYQTSAYRGANDLFRVKFNCGLREKAFMTDGKVTETVDYNTVTVTPLQADLYERDYAYKLVGANGTHEGKLTKSILGVSYTAEVIGGENIGVISAIEVSYDDKTAAIEVSDMIGAIDYKKALEIAYGEYKTEIDAEIEADDFKREVYIKLIDDRHTVNMGSYWYVSFIRDADNYMYVLLNPSDGSVMSKKK